MLDANVSVWLWCQLNWCITHYTIYLQKNDVTYTYCSIYMLRHSFVRKFLQEISIIVILILCLKFPISKCPWFVLIYYRFLSWLKVYDGINKFYRHTSITNLIRVDLARIRKFFFVLHHVAGSVKVYILIYLS